VLGKKGKGDVIHSVAKDMTAKVFDESGIKICCVGSSVKLSCPHRSVHPVGSSAISQGDNLRMILIRC
jgi:hypothetical protein